MGRWGLALGPETVEKIHERVVEIAQENQVVQGRKMRLDTTLPLMPMALESFDLRGYDLIVSSESAVSLHATQAAPR
jgi:hypothetical protein